MVCVVESNHTKSYMEELPINEEFVKTVYTSIVEDNVATYKKLFNETDIDEHTIDYWKRALDLYSKIDSQHQEVFFSIIKNVIIDTISNVFGVIDGVCMFDVQDWHFAMSINGQNTNDSLQDDFLEYVETVEAEE